MQAYTDQDVQTCLAFSGNLGTHRCARASCRKRMKPEDLNFDWLRGRREGLAAWCMECWIWYHADMRCRYAFGIDLAEKRRRYEAQDCCCAICHHYLEFERRSPHQKVAGVPTHIHRAQLIYNPEKYNPYCAVLDHQRGPDHPRGHITESGRVSAIRRFQEGDMLRAILCNLCNLSVSQLEEHGHWAVHEVVHEYLAYWNHQYSLYKTANPITRQQALDFDLDELAEAA